VQVIFLLGLDRLAQPGIKQLLNWQADKVSGRDFGGVHDRQGGLPFLGRFASTGLQEREPAKQNILKDIHNRHLEMLCESGKTEKVLP